MTFWGCYANIRTLCFRKYGFLDFDFWMFELSISEITCFECSTPGRLFSRIQVSNALLSFRDQNFRCSCFRSFELYMFECSRFKLFGFVFSTFEILFAELQLFSVVGYLMKVTCLSYVLKLHFNITCSSHLSKLPLKVCPLNYVCYYIVKLHLKSLVPVTFSSYRFGHLFKSPFKSKLPFQSCLYNRFWKLPSFFPST